MSNIPPASELDPLRDDQECVFVAEDIENRWPHLKQHWGFYDHPSGWSGDHSWNVAPDGTIVDMTASQFSGRHGIETEPHPEVIPPGHPFYDRYVSYELHPDRAGQVAVQHGDCPDCGHYEFDPKTKQILRPFTFPCTSCGATGLGSSRTAARLDQAGLYMKGLPHWEPMPYAGRDVSHRRWQWVDDNGVTHIVGCGSGQHGENAQREDFRQIRQRTRACEGGACQHSLVRAAAADPIGPWYHGTNVALSPGEHILPRAETGADTEFGDNPYYRDDVVYLTNGGDHMAERFAVSRAGRLGGEPRIYEVEPIGDLDRDPEQDAGYSTDQYVAPRARVIRELPLPGLVAYDPSSGLLRRRRSNVLDPVQDQLDPAVFLDSASPEPIVKPEIRKWIYDTIYKALTDAGYDGMEDWLSLVLTGSLTTYQYSERSDCDVSLFVDVPKFPEWSRAEMIGLMVENCDGQLVPGTTHPLQVFVVDTKKLSREDLYQPGLRSGYELATQRWIVPPDPGRVHDVQAEQYGDYFYALEVADKLDRLLTFEPEKAKLYYQAIHRRRQQDQQRGRGDASQSNIVYKMLDQKGLFDRLRSLGVKIARIASGMICPRCGSTLTRAYDHNPENPSYLCETCENVFGPAEGFGNVADILNTSRQPHRVDNRRRPDIPCAKCGYGKQAFDWANGELHCSGCGNVTKVPMDQDLASHLDTEGFRDFPYDEDVAEGFPAEKLGPARFGTSSEPDPPRNE